MPTNTPTIEEARTLLAEGHDWALRDIYSHAVNNVLMASARGDIGSVEFISEIRVLLNGMEAELIKSNEKGNE